MFEHRSQPLLSHREFLSRQLRFLFYSFLLIGSSLTIGTIGYHDLASLSWIDSFFNASMILTGMGPVSPMPTGAAKIFSSLYALFSGIIFLSTAAILIAPAAHRFLHIIHLEAEEHPAED